MLCSRLTYSLFKGIVNDKFSVVARYLKHSFPGVFNALTNEIQALQAPKNDLLRV